MHIVVLLLQLSITTPSFFEQLWAQGKNDLKHARYADAARILRAAINEGEKAGVPTTPLGVAINDLAEVYRRIGEYSEAESLFKRAITVLKKHPESARQLVVVLNNQGAMYAEMGMNFRSAASFEESFSIARKSLLKDDPLIGAILNGMSAGNSSAKGDLKSAQQHLEQSLRIRESILGPDHLDVSETLNNLAVVHYQRKQYGKAESAFFRAMAIMEKHLGPDHPDVAVTLNNLGVLYQERQEHGAAEKALRRSLAIRRKTLPENHPSIASSLMNLGIVMLSTTRPVEAQTLLQEAVAIRNQNPRELNAEGVATLERYAFALRLNGNASDADAVEARAKSMRAELKYTLKP